MSEFGRVCEEKKLRFNVGENKVMRSGNLSGISVSLKCRVVRGAIQLFLVPELDLWQRKESRERRWVWKRRLA